MNTRQALADAPALSQSPSPNRAAYEEFAAENARQAADRLTRMASELRAQRLDADIAAHVNAVHRALGLDGHEDWRPLTGFDALTWRANGDPLYREWEEDLYCAAYWDEREREAEADARYYRLATLWTRIGVAAVLLGLAALAVIHFTGCQGRL